jgi:hypothetical protein
MQLHPLKKMGQERIGHNCRLVVTDPELLTQIIDKF